MKLYLDTTDNLKTLIKLDDQLFLKTYQHPRQQDVLGALVAALKSQGKQAKDISQIEVKTGPGSFTGIRVGLSLAGALSFALNIPVNGQPPGTFIQPHYGQSPSITLSTKNPPRSH